ncbi:hypothetical protein B7463_g11712, partial [Scytalidium lignicola]
MADTSKPLILACATPIIGHLSPFREICRELIQRGYDVTVITGSHFKPIIESIGAGFVPLEGYADYTEADLNVRFVERLSYPPGPEQLAYDLTNVFFNCVPGQSMALQKGIKLLNETHPGRKIVVMTEAAFFGSVALKLGAPGADSIAGTVGIGIIPVVLSSIDLAPFGPGIMPDASASTPEGRARNAAMAEQFRAAIFGKVDPVYEEKLKEGGAITAIPKYTFGVDLPYLLHDRFVQMCTPSIEYPRSDAPATLRFAGGLPKSRSKNVVHPSWWADVTQKPQDKKIVFICQGTIANDVKELVLPTMEAFQDRDDWLVVVALGRKGLTLPEGTVVPSNVRVEDYILFDEILPYTSVFVTNGGYGALQHSIHSGVPLIMAGMTEDKPEVSARAEWAGIAVNLRTATPSPQAIRDAAEELTQNPKYKKRVLELQEEMKSFDPAAVVIANIEEVAAGTPIDA